MRLQKQKAYQYKGKSHFKYSLIIPEASLEKLKWQEGVELKEDIRGNTLCLRPFTEKELEELKNNSLNKEPIYNDFRESIRSILKQHPNGLTWTEIKEKFDFPQKVPNNQWVNQLEKDIGLKRIRQSSLTYWKIENDTIYTIGYEGKDIGAFVGILLDNRIEQVIDVRQLALSRKNGFSKGILANYLKQAGIVYKHYPILGSPRAIRQELYKDLDYKKFFNEYKEHIEDPEIIEQLRDVEGLSKIRRTALMCFEKDPQYCHRSILADKLSKNGWRISNLK